MFIAFSLYYFFNLKLFLTCFFQFIFVKRSYNFFPLRSLITYVHGTVFSTFLITKPSSDQFGVCNLWQNILVFWYSNIITNFKFWIFIINFFTKVNICVWFCIKRFILIVLWYMLLYLLTISSNLLMKTFFKTELIYL